MEKLAKERKRERGRENTYKRNGRALQNVH